MRPCDVGTLLAKDNSARLIVLIGRSSGGFITVTFMRRRQLLKYIWATTLATASSHAWSYNKPAPAATVALLKSVFPPSLAARQVGPHCGAASQSLEELFAQAGIDQATSPASILRDFEARREQDLTTHNTEVINGWVLARAETALIAILGQV